MNLKVAILNGGIPVGKMMVISAGSGFKNVSVTSSGPNTHIDAQMLSKPFLQAQPERYPSGSRPWLKQKKGRS